MKPTIVKTQLPPTEAEIQATSKALKCKLPKEYLDFLRKENGGQCLPDRLWLYPYHMDNLSLTFLYSIGERTWGEPSVLLATQLFRTHESVVGYIASPESYLAIGRDGGGNEILLGVAWNNFNQVSFWQHDGNGIQQLYDGNKPCSFGKLMDSFCYGAGSINDPFIHRCTTDELRILIESGRIPRRDLYGNSLRYTAETYYRQDILNLLDEMGL